MPYGVAKDVASPYVDAKIEMCVQQLIGKGHDKVSAIRICKSSIQDAERKKKAAAEGGTKPPAAT